MWLSVDGVARNSQFINIVKVGSPIWNSTEMGQEMRKLWIEHDLHSSVKHDFYCTDFRGTQYSLTALPVDPQYRVATFMVCCYYVCDKQRRVITMAAPQRELRVFNATVIHWTGLNNSKICYKFNLLNLKYSRCAPGAFCRPVRSHHSTPSPPTPPQHPQMFCVSNSYPGAYTEIPGHSTCPVRNG